MRKMVKVKCSGCGSFFEKYKRHYDANEKLGHKHYCSRKCSYSDRYTGSTCKCDWCGKLVYISKARAKKSKSGKVFCCRSCSNAHRNTLFTGSQHPNFKDADYRKKAIEHYGESCMRCGYNEVSGILQVHHKNRNNKDNDINNIEVLCPNCHMEEHYNTKSGLYHDRK